ncbi:MAG: efflux RND transporter periplasmic adaptor subunit [Gammaproteobacteria bacterium]|nr:efflux RND transporter periplasmic adaptor subunit [Gammaproteobacteria bacterium]
MRYLILILGMLLAAPVLAQGGGFPATVRIATVEMTELAPTIEVPGTVLSRDDARLAAEVAGNLIRIAEVGERVEEGAVVAKIQDALLLQQQLENEGLVRSRQARIDFLEREVARLQRLAAQNNAARSQLDQTESELVEARADLQVARARLAQIRIAVSRTEIRAPFTGRITQRFVNPGEHVAAGAAVVRLVGTDRIEVLTRAPLKTVAYLAEGAAVPLRSDFNSGSGSVRTMVPFGDSRSHMFEVRIDIPASDWIIGQSVRVTVPTAQARQVLAVPRDALVLRADGAAVFRISDDNKAERISVETGAGDGELIAIIAGEIKPGDKVVIRGAERLRPGQDVMIDGAAGGSAANTAASP